MIAIIDYDAGNLRSIQRALLETGAEVTITSDPKEVVAADRVVFPGDGHAKTAMETLRARGLVDAIHTSVNAGTPFLGVCVGMQLLFEHMEEGPTAGLGVLPGTVSKLPDTVKVPQIGWNTVQFRDDSPLQRIFRDLSMLRVHGFLDLETGSQALGRVSLGLPPQCVV